MPKVALIQMACGGTVEENTKKALAKVKEAAANGANIVVLPELFQHPYFPAEESNPEAFNRAEEIPGETMRQLAQAAKENHIILVGGSVFEREGDKYYNTAMTFDEDGDMIGKFRKCHIPQDPGFYEKDYFTPGDAIPVIDTKYGKICVMICYDQWFPEAAVKAAANGASLIIYPSAIGYPDSVNDITGDWRDMWQTAQRGHAACNQVYVAGLNRVGEESSKQGKTDFFGGSFIADYSGKMLSSLDKQEDIIYADCNFEHQKTVQNEWGILANRNPKLYRTTDSVPFDRTTWLKK